jgi:6-phosphogluconolactonase
MTKARFQWREFGSREELAQRLSEAVSHRLAQAVETKGTGLLAVSGGSTPKRFFEALSGAEIPWAQTTVTLCDERFVPPAHERSNEKLVRDNLLTHKAEAARFLPLFHQAEDVEQAAKLADSEFAQSPLPLDVAVLGMGNDGHTLSFFPDAQELDQALDRANPKRVMAIHAASTEEPRLTLTLPLVVHAGQTFLHIEGAAKREAFEHAMASSPALPIRAVAEALERPIEVFWAP